MRKHFKTKKGNSVEVFAKSASFGKGTILIYNVMCVNTYIIVKIVHVFCLICFKGSLISF